MKNSQMLIGKPRQYPQKLIEELVKLFAKIKKVRSAYIANVFNPLADETPHLAIGIDMEGNLNEIVNELRDVIKKNVNSNEMVDVFPANTPWLIDYFSSIEPFYKKKLNA